MKFHISRTSAYEEKPCEEAVQEYFTALDSRTVPTIEEARKHHWFKDWYENGVNHREENGHIVCDSKEKRPYWVIEINSLDDLLALEKKYGSLVIERPGWMGPKGIDYEVEIYDDYRE